MYKKWAIWNTKNELAYRYVYPAVKRRLVEILYNEYKLTQQEIARLLYISQSTASRYKNLARRGLIDLSKFKDIDEEIHRLAKKCYVKNQTNID